MSARTSCRATPKGRMSGPLSKRAKKPAAKRSRERAGQVPNVTHAPFASAAPLSTEIGGEGGHASADTHDRFASPAAETSPDQEGHVSVDTHGPRADLVSEIRETHRRRQDFHRAEKSLTLQIKSIKCRICKRFILAHLPARLEDIPLSGFDGETVKRAVGELRKRKEVGIEDGVLRRLSAICELSSVLCLPAADDSLYAPLPLADARAGIKKHRLTVERELVALAKQLPAIAFVESVHGFGALGLAQIVGEAGDLSNYANPAKLWKRMGLAVINGKSQRRVAGVGALEQGYSPIRRSIIFVIGDSLLKKQNAYRELYLTRKAFEQSKVPDGSKMLWHRRAHRYAEKRLLRDLWRAWNGQFTSANQDAVAPAPSAFEPRAAA